MSGRSGKITHRLVVTAAAAISISISDPTADWAYGSQLRKGDKRVVEQREVRNYERPRRNGNRIAFCTAEGKCGKPAADQFCRDNEFEGALTFQRERIEGHSSKLRFFRIKCWRSKAGTASDVAGAEVISNTSAKSNRR